MEHHFAHAAGHLASCKEAHAMAISRFAKVVTLRAQAINLPGTLGPAPVLSAEATIIGDVGALEIVSRNARRLTIVLSTSDIPRQELKAHFASDGVSAMHVDLSGHKTKSDEHIAFGIVRTADRSWIHNEKAGSVPNVSGGRRNYSIDELWGALFPHASRNGDK
jgi:hypothetical protein